VLFIGRAEPIFPPGVQADQAPTWWVNLFGLCLGDQHYRSCEDDGLPDSLLPAADVGVSVSNKDEGPKD